MRYLLDTAAFAANVLTPHILPSPLRKILDTDDVKGLCGVSLLELAIHYRHGRLHLAGELKEFFDLALAKDIQLLDITPAIAEATNALPREFPGDPFDRTIAATARVMKLTLITPDKEIRDSGFCSVQFYPYRSSRASRS